MLKIFTLQNPKARKPDFKTNRPGLQSKHSEQPLSPMSTMCFAQGIQLSFKQICIKYFSQHSKILIYEAVLELMHLKMCVSGKSCSL